MFSAALLVYSGAISAFRTRKFVAAKVVGLSVLIELILKVGSIAEATRFFTEMGMSILKLH